jgi:pyruvate/2-oxoglutarate dehydrogenase complex dihydrolipoamide acyltransferase (E2) component
MPTVTMPQLGEGVAEGTIGKWLKQVGDHVGRDEPLVEVITDKVNAEVPSPFEGTLTEILAPEGQVVPNEAAIAVVQTADEGAATGDAAPARDAGSTPPAGPATAPAAPTDAPGSADPSQAPDAPAATATAEGEAPASRPTTSPPSAQTTQTNGSAPAEPSGTGTSGPVAAFTGRTTPAVRRLAREHGVDLSRVEGTGLAGRVTREDVARWVEEHGSRPGEALPASGPAPAAPDAPGATTPAAPAAAGDTLKELSPMRRAIAGQMTRSLAVPAAYLTIEVDMTAVARRRQAVRREYEAREGQSLSYVAFVTKACVEALRRHPDLNAHWTDEGHWLRRAVNVGIAVAVDDGLIVPVIRNADGLSLHGLNLAINDLAERARAGRLRMDDIQGGTFTVDNTGWTGSILTLPIINVPEVAIVTMERIVRRPVVIDGPGGEAIAVRSMMNMCIGFDHRATDGAQAGRFLSDVRAWLEAVDDQTSIW